MYDVRQNKETNLGNQNGLPDYFRFDCAIMEKAGRNHVSPLKKQMAGLSAEPAISLGEATGGFGRYPASCQWQRAAPRPLPTLSHQSHYFGFESVSRHSSVAWFEC